jgi:hypothetical protein
MWPSLGGIAHGPAWHGKGPIERTFDPQTVLLYSSQMRPPRHECYLMTSAR